MEGPKRILLVEDEFLVATEMCEEVRDLGLEVAGPCASVEEALAEIRSTEIDAALVDINLGGTWAYPIADELMARDVPFAFTSGYDRASILDRYGHVPRICKPVPVLILRNAIQTMLEPRPDDQEAAAT
jgi:DNA-binding response OmpR family regulator